MPDTPRPRNSLSRFLEQDGVRVKWHVLLAVLSLKRKPSIARLKSNSSRDLALPAIAELKP